MIANSKIGLIALIILISGINVLNAQNETSDIINKTYSQLKIRTELVNWTQLNPNLYFEFKINEKIGVSSGVLYHFTGLIWSAPQIMFRDNSRTILEWSYLRGYGLDLGIKLYSKSTKYYYLSCKIDRLSLNRNLYWSERLDDQETGTVNYHDIHLRLLRGYEFYTRRIQVINAIYPLLLINCEYT